MHFQIPSFNIPPSYTGNCAQQSWTPTVFMSHIPIQLLTTNLATQMLQSSPVYQSQSFPQFSLSLQQLQYLQISTAQQHDHLRTHLNFGMCRTNFEADIYACTPSTSSSRPPFVSPTHNCISLVTQHPLCSHERKIHHSHTAPPSSRLVPITGTKKLSKKLVLNPRHLALIPTPISFFFFLLLYPVKTSPSLSPSWLSNFRLVLNCDVHN